jgi:hypothetical protein
MVPPLQGQDKSDAREVRENLRRSRNQAAAAYYAALKGEP